MHDGITTKPSQHTAAIIVKARAPLVEESVLITISPFSFQFYCIYTFTMGDEGYDPRRSKVSDDTMEAWKQTPITGDLSEVPGIGPAAIKKLSECDEGPDRITNTFQLFGKFLMLKGPGHGDETMVEPFEHTQKFWEFLKNRGISSHRSAIVKAIAEKSATFFSGIYDANAYDDDDDDEE